MEDFVRLTSDELTEVGYFDGYLFYSINCETGTAEVSRAYNNHFEYFDHLVIPDVLYVDGISYIITSIGKKAFQDCWYLSSVIISDNVLYIDDEAFKCCSNLSNIKLGKNIRSIGKKAFSGCGHLQSIVIPNGVTKIGANAFDWCDLYSVRLPESILEIGDNAFIANPNLVEINFPKDIKKMGERIVDPMSFVFNYYKDVVYINDYVLGYKEGGSNTTEVQIKDGTKYICSGAFELQKELTSVSIPNGVQNSGKNIFWGCSNLQCVYNDNVFFYLNENFTGEYRIPDGIRLIAGGAFQDCNELTTIYLPNSIIEIGESAFSGCSNLKSINIPSSVKHIRENAFAGCLNLTNIDFSETTGIEINDDSIEQLLYPDKFLVVDNLLYKLDYECHSANLIRIISNHNSHNELQRHDELISHTLTIHDEICCNEEKFIVRRIEENAFAYLNDIYNTVNTIIIPDSIEEIGASAFSNLSSLKKVTMGNGIKKIGKAAFACSGISSIVIPHNVRKIGEYAFSSCPNLQYVLFLSPFITFFERGLFMDSGLIYLNMPERLKYISQYAFRDCKSLDNISLPDSLTCVESSSFEGCINLNKIRFPKKPFNLGRLLFGGFEGTGVTSVTIPGCVKKIDDNAFKNSSKLKTVTIRDGVEEIGKSAFANCTCLTKIIIPGSVKRIGRYAFRECSKLRTVIICDGVEEIGIYAFENCTNLIKIIIPESITVVDECFKGCDKLQVVYNKKIFAFFNKKVTGSYMIPEGITTIARGAFSNIKNAKRLFSITIPGSVKEIGEDSFNNCTNIKKVYIQEGVKAIGPDAFHWCSNLSHITIPKSVNSIGSSAFEGCSKLQKIILPDNVKDIGDFCFHGCSELTEIYLGKNLERIGDYAFCDCTKITNIVIPKKTIEIGNYAFANCSISFIEIPAKVNVIGDGSFAACELEKIVVSKRNKKYDSRQNCNAIIDTALNKLVLCSKNTNIPNSIITIGKGAFSSCGEMPTIILPDNINEIEESAFESCYGLKTIFIPANTTKIGEKTFEYCNSLEKIVVDSQNPIYDSRDNCNAIVIRKNNCILAGCGKTVIPTSVVSIGKNAFYGCISLTSIEIPESIRHIGESAFEECENLTSIVIPKNVRAVEQKAFYSTGLKEITIYSEKIDIGNLAFECEYGSLRRVYLHIIDPLQCKADFIFDPLFIDEDWWTVNAHSIDLFVPNGTSNLYKMLLPWRNMRSINEFDSDSINHI